MVHFLKTILWFLGRCLGNALLMAIGMSLVFAVFGLIAWFFSGDSEVILIASIFGMILGALLGIGQVFIKTFGEKPERVKHDNVGAEIAQDLAGRALPPLEPLLFVYKIFLWFFTTDFKAQRPRRGKRALIGALVLGAIALGMIAFLGSVLEEKPESLTFWQMLWAVPVAAAIGALLGAVSDSL
jgi:hypothetical protein